MSAEKPPFFSIVIPTFNRAHLIKDAVDSVIAQSFTDWNLIVVDDGSTDGTGNLLAPYLSDARIKYIWQANAGRSAARNVGIDLATGAYVCFLDSDDVWLPHHLHTLHASCVAHPGPAIHHTYLQQQHPDGSIVQTNYPADSTLFNPIERVFRTELSPITAAISIDQLMAQPFNINLSVNEDLELFARLAVHCALYTIPEYTAQMRVTGANTTDYVPDYLDQMLEVIDLLKQHPETGPYLSGAFVAERTKTIREWKIRKYEKDGQRWLLMLHLIRFLILYPTTPRNRAKFVLLLYNLPGGGVIKRLFGRGN